MWHMEKQEFRPGYPLWIWAVIAIMLVACTCLFIKSIVIRYRKEGMYHNFLVIKKDDVNIEGILNAILHYHPSVSVR